MKIPWNYCKSVVRQNPSQQSHGPMFLIDGDASSVVSWDQQSYCVLLCQIWLVQDVRSFNMVVPKMGVHPNHPFQMGFSWFSTINHPLLATPLTMETPYVTDKKGQSWPVCSPCFSCLITPWDQWEKRSRFQKIIQSSRCLVGHREAIGDVHCTSLTSDVLAMGSSSYA